MQEGKRFLQIFQGFLAGAAFILPGISAGTVILLCGFYRKLMEDIAAFRFMSHLPFLGGAATGALATAYAGSYLFATHPVLLRAFLLGMLLAVPVTLFQGRRERFLFRRDGLLACGALALAWLAAGTSPGAPPLPAAGGSLHFFMGGLLAGATTLLPGISGGAVLIMLNLYEAALLALTTWQWPAIITLGSGVILGLLGLARLLALLYRRHPAVVSPILAGLILGSTRALAPWPQTMAAWLLLLAGGALVFYLGRRSPPG